MKSLEDLKNFEYKDGNWFDENNNELKVIWSEFDGRFNVEHTIFEEIIPFEKDGVTYTRLTYVYGEGLVVTDSTQRYTLKVNSLKNNINTENTTDIITKTKKNKNDNTKDVNFTGIYNNEIHSAYIFENGEIISVKGKKYKVQLNRKVELSDNEIEISYGAWAIENDETKEQYKYEYVYNYEEVG